MVGKGLLWSRGTAFLLGMAIKSGMPAGRMTVRSVLRVNAWE